MGSASAEVEDVDEPSLDSVRKSMIDAVKKTLSRKDIKPEYVLAVQVYAMEEMCKVRYV